MPPQEAEKKETQYLGEENRREYKEAKEPSPMKKTDLRRIIPEGREGPAKYWSAGLGYNTKP